MHKYIIFTYIYILKFIYIYEEVNNKFLLALKLCIHLLSHIKIYSLIIQSYNIFKHNLTFITIKNIEKRKQMSSSANKAYAVFFIW